MIIFYIRTQNLSNSVIGPGRLNWKKMLNKETGAGTLSTFALPLYFDA